MSPERLQKILATAGVASRRDCEELIAAGRVAINGRVVRTLGTRVDPETDEITLDGNPISQAAPRTYVMLNKPTGVVSTAEDTHGRPTVVEQVESDARLFPVGRLDMDSEGLIIMTDDGELAQRLTHPSYEVEKEYKVLLNQPLTTEAIRSWRDGVELDGEMTAPAWVELIEQTDEGAWVRVVLREGRKRQIREVAQLLGYEVLRLIRVREGALLLGDLAPGESRPLTEAEVTGLREHAVQRPAEPRRAPRRAAAGPDRPERPVRRPPAAPSDDSSDLAEPEDDERQPLHYDDRVARRQRPQIGYRGRPQGGGYGGRPQGGGYRDRPQGGYGDRPARRDDRPQGGGYGDRPQGGGYRDRPQGGGYRDRPQGGYGDRPQGGYRDRPQGGGYRDRPQGGGYGARPPRPQGGGYGDRPQGGGYRDRPQGGYNDRPPRPQGGYGDRPQGGGYRDRPQGSYGDRPPRRDDRPQGGYGDRPPRRDDRPQGGYGDRPQGGGYRDRPQGGYNDRPPRRDDRPQGGYNDRPPRRDDRPQGGGYGDRPQGGGYRDRPQGGGYRDRPQGGYSDRPPRRDDRPQGGYGDRPPRRDDRPPRRDDRPPRNYDRPRPPREGEGSDE